MQYGITLLNTGTGSDPHILAELAREAEERGWDGAFLWDCIDIEKTLGSSGREHAIRGSRWPPSPNAPSASGLGRW